MRSQDWCHPLCFIETKLKRLLDVIKPSSRSAKISASSSHPLSIMRLLSTALLAITHGVIMDKISLAESKLVGGTSLFESEADPCTDECKEDSDCNRVCYDGVCKPLPDEPCPCDKPKKIPDMCEVNILMKYMEAAVNVSPKLLGQWTRAGFHDAGTYDQTVPEGGANGCLMNEPLMLLQHENYFLDGPVAVLKVSCCDC